jgi:hypothetical protein
MNDFARLRLAPAGCERHKIPLGEKMASDEKEESREI